MDIGIYSFAINSLNYGIIESQKHVFDNFNLDLHQIIEKPAMCPYQQHGDVINDIIENATEEFVVIFDIDCIPLDRKFHTKISDSIADGQTLSGAEGSSGMEGHLRDYIHAGFIGFSKSLYVECGRPSMAYYVDGRGGDTAQRFTDECELMNKNLDPWKITHSNDEVFCMHGTDVKFGHGTVYEDLIYHQFNISAEFKHTSHDQYTRNQREFISKCGDVISTS
jgi:hypothetical protein